MANVMLDFTGGVFSLLQNLIDTLARGQSLFNGDSFNVVKFMLSIMSIVFDLIFMFQHFFLYRDKHVNDGNRTRRLESDAKLQDLERRMAEKD